MLALLLEEQSENICEEGYGQPWPDVVGIVAGHIVVAGLDSTREYSAPDLSVYSPDVVAQWAGSIRDRLRSESGPWPELDLEELLEETRPRGGLEGD
jgi:hypothetical protein